MSASAARQRPASPGEGALAATWLGHATVLIELDGARLLTDPALGARVGPLRRIGPAPAPESWAGVDAVLLSHMHADHADVPSLRALGAGTLILAPRGTRAWLAARGLSNVQELAPGEHASVEGVTVTATPALHGGGRWRARPTPPAVGFLACRSRCCYFAGDTDLFGAMEELRGRVELALVPISGWGPKVGAGHLDPARAAEALRMIAPRVAVPIHWGTLAPPRPLPGPARDDSPAREFTALAARRAPGVEVRVLAPGERLVLDAGAEAQR